MAVMVPNKIVATVGLLLGPLAAQPVVPTRPQPPPAAGSVTSLEASLRACKVHLADAVARATARVHGVAVRAAFVAADNERPAYFEVEVAKDGALWRVQVDAKNGDVTLDERRQAAPSVLAFDFEGDELPPDFVVRETQGRGRPATWRTAASNTTTDGERVLAVETANAGSTFNLLLRPAAVGPDLQLDVRVQAVKGQEDQGGGLVWRARDSDNYYVVRWNPLENNLRLYTVVDGQRSLPLADVEIRADPQAWHDLRVVAVATKITVSFDGAARIAVEDSTFVTAGGIGLWSKADACTRFDALRLTSLGK